LRVITDRFIRELDNDSLEVSILIIGWEGSCHIVGNYMFLRQLPQEIDLVFKAFDSVLIKAELSQPKYLPSAENKPDVKCMSMWKGRRLNRTTDGLLFLERAFTH
jgi:hypothetical protein